MLNLDTETPLISRKGQLKYEQLKRLLLDQLAKGKLKPGDMLPPEVDLAQQMGVARNTVRQAMRELELQNVIRRVRGKGTIICEASNTLTPAQTAGQLWGLVLPELRTGMYQSLQGGMNKSMAVRSDNMILCDSGQDLYQQVDSLLRLAHRGVSGVALVPVSATKTPAHHLAFFRRSRLPLVFCHRAIEGVAAPLIGFSPFEMGGVAAGALAKLGHRRLGMIFSHASESSSTRIRGAREALAEYGGEVPEDFIHFDSTFRADALPEGLEERLTQRIKAMLDSPRPPTGFIVSADRLAAMTCRVMQNLGLTVPDDASVIGFGDRSNRDTVLPCKLTSVTVDEWELGRIAFEILSQIQRGERSLDDHEQILMPLEVSEGESIGPAR